MYRGYLINIYIYITSLYIYKIILYVLDFSVMLQGLKACKLRKDGRREGVAVGKRERAGGERQTETRRQ